MTAQQNVSRNIRELYVSDGERTFQFDNQLPPLPLPRLRDTLTRYLESIRHLVNQSEWQQTTKLVQTFEQGIGSRLQAYLEQKSNQNKNWLEQWWLEYAYLRGRQSLVPFSNIAAAMPSQPFWPDTTKPTEIAYRAALVLKFTLDFYGLLRDERMRPMLHKQHYWSMDQFRRLFNTCRVPKPEVDELRTHFTTRFESNQVPSLDIIVLYKGHIFRMNGADTSPAAPPSTCPTQSTRFCSVRHLYEQLKGVLEHPVCKTPEKGPAVGTLTSAPRSRWAQNRDHLIQLSDRNRTNLDVIEKSLMCISFDQDQPRNASERLKCTACGSPEDRWADKSVCHVFYANGASGAICEHTPFDGFASALITHYVLTCLNECAGQWPESTSGAIDTDSEEISVELLQFDLDQSIMAEIEWARTDYYQNCARLNMLNKSFNGYGKKMLKPLRFHPEAYIQVALQVAYDQIKRKNAQLHLAPPTCYCTASTRQFYNGRTETVRSCTAEAAELACLIAEQRPFTTEHLQALRKATNKFQQLMTEAMSGQGIDRHFLGLYCASVETEEPLPEIFLDPAFSMSGSGGNYVLSSSCAGYWNITGGVPPMREDGYGIFYGIEDDALHFLLIEYKDNGSTDAELMFDHICDTLVDFEHIVQKAKL